MVLPSSVKPCSSDSFSNHEGTALSKIPVRLRLRPGRALALREDSRIAAKLDWHLKALMNRSVNGNSAFFSRSEKATFAEILKLDEKWSKRFIGTGLIEIALNSARRCLYID